MLTARPSPPHLLGALEADLADGAGPAGLAAAAALAAAHRAGLGLVALGAAGAVRLGGGLAARLPGPAPSPGPGRGRRLLRGAVPAGRLGGAGGAAHGGERRRQGERRGRQGDPLPPACAGVQGAGGGVPGLARQAARGGGRAGLEEPLRRPPAPADRYRGGRANRRNRRNRRGTAPARRPQHQPPPQPLMAAPPPVLSPPPCGELVARRGRPRVAGRARGQRLGWAELGSAQQLAAGFASSSPAACFVLFFSLILSQIHYITSSFPKLKLLKVSRSNIS